MHPLKAPFPKNLLDCITNVINYEKPTVSTSSDIHPYTFAVYSSSSKTLKQVFGYHFRRARKHINLVVF